MASALTVRSHYKACGMFKARGGHAKKRYKMSKYFNFKAVAEEVAKGLATMTGDDVRVIGSHGWYYVERWTGSKWVRG
jgi:hypothetical protein